MKRSTMALLTIVVSLVWVARSFSADSKHGVPGGTQTGIAACYSQRLAGHRTTSGQKYDPKALTAAHHKIPIGTQVKVTNIENGQSVVVTVNDHLTASRGIIMDISKQACTDLKFPHGGKAKVKIEVVDASGVSASH